MMVYIGTLRGKTTPELCREVVHENGFTVYLQCKLFSKYQRFEKIPARYHLFRREFTIPPIPLYQHIISLLPAETQQSPTNP